MLSISPLSATQTWLISCNHQQVKPWGFIPPLPNSKPKMERISLLLFNPLQRSFKSLSCKLLSLPNRTRSSWLRPSPLRLLLALQRTELSDCIKCCPCWKCELRASGYRDLLYRTNQTYEGSLHDTATDRRVGPEENRPPIFEIIYRIVNKSLQPTTLSLLSLESSIYSSA